MLLPDLRRCWHSALAQSDAVPSRENARYAISIGEHDRAAMLYPQTVFPTPLEERSKADGLLLHPNLLTFPMRYLICRRAPQSFSATRTASLFRSAAAKRRSLLNDVRSKPIARIGFLGVDRLAGAALAP
jgi:hypothetical protein